MKQKAHKSNKAPQHNGADGITSHEYAEAIINNKAHHLIETPASLLLMGMCVCDACGRLCCADYKWCESCQLYIVIIKKN